MQYVNVIFNFKIKYVRLCFFVWCVNFCGGLLLVWLSFCILWGLLEVCSFERPF